MYNENHILAENGTNTSPNYVAELMREMGLESIGRHSKREYKKTASLTKRQNTLQQQFDVSKPNRVWVSDTTCFKVKDKYYYNTKRPHGTLAYKTPEKFGSIFLNKQNSEI